MRPRAVSTAGQKKGIFGFRLTKTRQPRRAKEAAFGPMAEFAPNEFPARNPAVRASAIDVKSAVGLLIRLAPNLSPFAQADFTIS
jgi:hypothetical protein